MQYIVLGDKLPMRLEDQETDIKGNDGTGKHKSTTEV